MLTFVILWCFQINRSEQLVTNLVFKPGWNTETIRSSTKDDWKTPSGSQTEERSSPNAAAAAILKYRERTCPLYTIVRG